MNDEQRDVFFATDDDIMLHRNDNPLMFTGIHLINRSLLDRVPDGFSCIFQAAYRPAIEHGEAIFGYQYDGYWRDLGSMEQYQDADRELSQARVTLNYI